MVEVEDEMVLCFFSFASSWLSWCIGESKYDVIISANILTGSKIMMVEHRSSVSDFDWEGPALNGGKGGIHPCIEFPTNLGCSPEEDAELYQFMKLDHENYTARLVRMGDEGCKLSGSTGSISSGTFNDSNHPMTTDEATVEVNDKEGVSDEVPIDGLITFIGKLRETKMVGVDYQMPHNQNMIELVADCVCIGGRILLLDKENLVLMMLGIIVL